MILSVNSTKYLRGTIHLPASKSYSIRAFMIAACGGLSRIIDPSDCDDARVARDVTQELGMSITRQGRNIYCLKPRLKSKFPSRIHVKQSGTVLRFLLPLISLKGKNVLVTGEKTLIGRPNKHLTEVLRAQGVLIQGQGPKESVPIHIKGGVLQGGRIDIEGSLSSQFISALLIACSGLESDTDLHIKGQRIVSSDYITMTCQVLKKSGIHINKMSPRRYHIKGGQNFKGLQNFKIPSDYGLAAFLMAAGALTDSDVILHGNFQDDLIQADGRILGFLKSMGVNLIRTRDSIRVHGPYQLKAGNFCLKDCPDLVPIMAVLALFAKGRTRLYDIEHARVKESDRISDLTKELLKLGAKIQEGKKEIIIYSSGSQTNQSYKRNVLLDPHHDHRLAMAFSVLGVKCPVRVKDIGCVSKSYPRFVSDFKKMGVDAHLCQKG